MQTSDLPNENQRMYPDLPVLQSVVYELHLEFLRKTVAVLGQSPLDLLALGCVQELGGGRRIRHDKVCGHTDDEGSKAFDDEDPCPAIKATDAIHLHQSTGKQSAEGTSKCRSREEERHAETALASFIPHGDATKVSMF